MADYLSKVEKNMGVSGESNAWKYVNYKRSIFDSMKDKARGAKKGFVRDESSFFSGFTKNARDRDTNFMERAQDFMDRAAKELGLFGLFSADSIANFSIQQGIYKQGAQGDGKAGNVVGTVGQALGDVLNLNKKNGQGNGQGDGQGDGQSDGEGGGEDGLGIKLADGISEVLSSEDINNTLNTVTDLPEAVGQFGEAAHSTAVTTDKTNPFGSQKSEGNVQGAGMYGMVTNTIDVVNNAAGMVQTGLSLRNQYKDTKSNWHHMNGYDRAEAIANIGVTGVGGVSQGLNVAAGVGGIYENYQKFANPTAAMNAPESVGWNTKMGGAATAIEGGAQMIGSGVTAFSQHKQLGKQKRLEKLTRMTKMFHKKKGQTRAESVQAAQDEAQAAAMRSAAERTNSRVSIQFEGNEAVKRVRRQQSKYYAKRAGQKAKRNMHRDKRRRAVAGFFSGMLKVASGVLKATGVGGPASYVLDLAEKGVDKVSGKVFDHLQDKETRNLIDTQLMAMRLSDMPGSENLQDITCYDDLKKKMKYQYIIKTKFCPELRHLTDADFKTLMSNSLSGMSGGKKGFANSIAMGHAEAMKNNTEALNAFGLNTTSGRPIGTETIANQMGFNGEAASGEYTGHQARLAADAAKKAASAPPPPPPPPPAPPSSMDAIKSALGPGIPKPKAPPPPLHHPSPNRAPATDHFYTKKGFARLRPPPQSTPPDRPVPPPPVPARRPPQPLPPPPPPPAKKTT